MIPRLIPGTWLILGTLLFLQFALVLAMAFAD
jgi:flagellin-like protein